MSAHVWEDDDAKFRCLGTMVKEENNKCYYKAVEKTIKDSTEPVTIFKKGDKAYLHAPKGETYLAEIDSIFFHKSKKIIGFEARWFYGPKDLTKVNYAPNLAGNRPKFDPMIEWLYSDHKDENTIEMIKKVCNIVFVPSDLPLPPALEESRNTVVSLCKKHTTLFCRYALHIENEQMMVEKLTKEKLEREFQRRYPSIPEEVRQDIVEKDSKYFKQFSTGVGGSGAPTTSTSSTGKESNAGKTSAANATSSSAAGATSKSTSNASKSSSSAPTSSSGSKKETAAPVTANPSSSKKEKDTSSTKNKDTKANATSSASEEVVGEKRKSSSLSTSQVSANEAAKVTSASSSSRKTSRGNQVASISSLFDDDDYEEPSTVNTNTTAISAQFPEGKSENQEKYSWMDIASVPDKQGYRLKQMLDYSKRAEDLAFVLWYRKERVIKHQSSSDPAAANILTERDFKLWKSLTIDTDLIQYVNMVNNWKKDLKAQASPSTGPVAAGAKKVSQSELGETTNEIEESNALPIVSTRASSTLNNAAKLMTQADYNKARRERIRNNGNDTPNSKKYQDDDEEFSEDMHFAVTNEDECIAIIPEYLGSAPKLSKEEQALMLSNCVCNAAPLTALQESVYLIACMEEVSKAKRNCLLTTISHQDDLLAEQPASHGLLSVDGRIVVPRVDCMELFQQSLYLSQGNIKKALERVRQQISLPQAMVIWDVKEQRIVLKAYEKYGAHYHALRRTLKTKTWKDTLQYISRYLRMPNKYETNVLQPLQSVDGSRGKDLKTTTTTSSSSSSSLFERNLNTTANDSPVVDYFNLDKDETDSKVSNDQGNSAMHPDLQDDSMYFDMDQNSDLEDNASEFDVEEPSTAIGSNSQSNGNGSKRPSKTNATKNNIRFQQMLIKFLEWFDELSFHQLLSTLLLWHHRILSPAELAVRLIHLLHEAVYIDSDIPITLLINAAFSEDVETQQEEQSLVINAYLTKAKQCKEFFLNEFKELFPSKLQDRVMKMDAGGFYPMHQRLEDVPVKWTDNAAATSGNVSSFLGSGNLEDETLSFPDRKTPSPQMEPIAGVAMASSSTLDPSLLINNPYLSTADDANNEMLIDIPPELAMEWFSSGQDEQSALVTTTIAVNSDESNIPIAEVEVTMSTVTEQPSTNEEKPQDAWLTEEEEEPSVTTKDATEEGSTVEVGSTSAVIQDEVIETEEVAKHVVPTDSTSTEMEMDL